jgi:DivIVA domain-containing protein
MATALIYLVVLLVVAALFFAAASVLFGRGEELAPVPPGSTPTWLPDGAVGAADVRALRFQQAVRGYRMAEVDWALDRLAAELEQVTRERDALRERLAGLGAAPAPDTVLADQPTTAIDRDDEVRPERTNGGAPRDQ